MVHRDGSGQLDVQEIVMALRDIDPDIDIAKAQEIIKEIDMDGNGLVSYAEFQKMMRVSVTEKTETKGREKKTFFGLF